jgi:peptide/nickel transport system ATP-binding protein
MSAFPSVVGPKRPLAALPGEPPDLLHPPKGCRFHPRCPRVKDICREQVPAFQDFGGGHFAACWNPVEAG